MQDHQNERVHVRVYSVLVFRPVCRSSRCRKIEASSWSGPDVDFAAAGPKLAKFWGGIGLFALCGGDGFLELEHAAAQELRLASGLVGCLAFR